MVNMKFAKRRSIPAPKPVGKITSRKLDAASIVGDELADLIASLTDPEMKSAAIRAFGGSLVERANNSQFMVQKGTVQGEFSGHERRFTIKFKRNGFPEPPFVFIKNLQTERNGIPARGVTAYIDPNSVTPTHCTLVISNPTPSVYAPVRFAIDVTAAIEGQGHHYNA